MVENEKSTKNIAEFIEFLRNNVYNISEITRQNKLTEILNSFSGEKTEEVFIVQNSKSKDAQGALVDVEFLVELLEYKRIFLEALEDAKDEMVYETAIQRKNAPATKNIGQVAAQFDLSWDDIVEAKKRVEID